MNKRLLVPLLAASMILPGCATRPENVAASHVSSSRYTDRTCKSLNRELDEIQDALRASAGRLNDKANQDAVVTGVGVILFWPALFALGNNGGLEADVARLKGEDQAVRRALRDNNCERDPAPAQPQAAPQQTTSASPAAQPAAQPLATASPASETAAMLPVPARRGDGVQ